MKPYHLILVLSGFMLGCASAPEKAKPIAVDSVQNDRRPDTLQIDNGWHDEFLLLQKAIAQSDRKALKQFIEFPILSPGNDIWHLVDVNQTMKIPKGVKPFTEADYDKYFEILFGYNFPPAIKQVNAEELFKANSAATPFISDKRGVLTGLEVMFDNYANRLTLRLITKNEQWEFSRFYHFKIGYGKLTLQSVVVSG